MHALRTGGRTPAAEPRSGLLKVAPHRLWMLAFFAFFLMIGAWAVAAPYDATADEHDHIYRAVGVAAGEIMPEPAEAVRGSGAFQSVPMGLVRPFPPESLGGNPMWSVEQPCWSWQQLKSAACAVPPSADGHPALVGTGAGRYHPLYYGAVGLPLKWWPGWPGVLLARLLSAAMAAALLAGAVVAIVRHSRHGLMMAGLLAAATPMTFHFMAAINPNGVEIAAGIAFFAGIIPLLLGKLSEKPRGLLALVGISAVCLATLRPTGLMYLAVGAVAFLFPLRSGNTPALWRMRAARWWAAGIAAAGAIAMVWVVVMKATDPGSIFTFGRHWTLSQAIYQVSHRWGDWLEQAIGVFNWGETRMPASAYLIWEFIGGTLLVLAFVFGRWIDRWRMFLLIGGAVLLPTAIQVYYANKIGFVTQGRYMLPGLVGIMLMAAYVIEERGLPVAQVRALTRLFVIVLLPIHLFALSFAMVRWQRGLPEFYGITFLINPFVGEWHPVVGSWTPVIALICGLGILGWLAWQATSVDAALRRPWWLTTHARHQWRPDRLGAAPISPAGPASSAVAPTTAPATAPAAPVASA